MIVICTALERPIEYQNQMERMKSDFYPAFPIGPVTTVGHVTPGSTTTTTTTTTANHAMANRAMSLPDTRLSGVSTKSFVTLLLTANLFSFMFLNYYCFQCCCYQLTVTSVVLRLVVVCLFVV